MATNTRKIETLEGDVAKLSERVALIEFELKSLGESVERLNRSSPDHDKRSALLERDLERLDKRFSEVDSRRWGLVQGVALAVLGGLLTLVITMIVKRLN